MYITMCIIKSRASIVKGGIETILPSANKSVAV